ncbi:hypothetical protein ACLKA6_016345 [Drosophila palustris]
MGTWRLMTRSNRTRCFGPSSSLSSTSITVGVSGRTGNLAGLLFVALAGGWATACTGGCAIGYAGGCGCGGWPLLIWPDDPHRDGSGGGGAYASLAICRPGVMGTWRQMTRSNRTSLAAGPLPAVVPLATLAAAAPAAGPGAAPAAVAPAAVVLVVAPISGLSAARPPPSRLLASGTPPLSTLDTTLVAASDRRPPRGLRLETSPAPEHP